MTPAPTPYPAVTAAAGQHFTVKFAGRAPLAVVAPDEPTAVAHAAALLGLPAPAPETPPES